MAVLHLRQHAFVAPAFEAPEVVEAIIETLDPSGWRVLREVTLEALRDSPGAFIADHAAERELPESEWQRRAAEGIWLVSRAGRKPVAIAHLTRGTEPETGVRFIESVWVAKAWRRRGLVRDMLVQFENCIRGQEVKSLDLWVLEKNGSARNAYHKLGFTPTQHRQKLRVKRGGVRYEIRMSKDYFF